MRNIGLIILSIGLLGLSIILGIAKISFYLDKLSGEFFSDWYKYVDFSMLFPILIVLMMGIIVLFMKRK
ncbi:hypothetical protein ACQKCU_11215 [Heyndrickxia sporothermodurans]